MRRSLSPSTTIFISTMAFVVISIFTSALGIFDPFLTLNENQILYLFSTTAQVIAAVYGLTLTGFLFFLNELNRETKEDETLEEAIAELKTRYFNQLVFITALVGLTLLLANLVISHETSSQTDITTMLINTGQSAFAVGFIAIVIFVFDVIAPQRIEKASQNLQNELDPSRDRETRGSLEEFLQNYNQIERLLFDAGEIYKSFTSTSIHGGMPKRMSNMRLADILFRSEQIGSDLHSDLRELITLRNAIIHGAEPVVSQDLVVNSASVLAKLRDAVLRNNK